MARAPSRAHAAAARKAAARESLPIRFIADYDHVEPNKTVAYRAGMVLIVPAEHRQGALDSGRAVVDGD